jgi:copper(I)-binding protein
MSPRSHRPTPARRRAAAPVVAATLFGLAACGSDEPTELATNGAWARPTPTGATNGVVYLTLTTDIDDTLVAATVPADVAAEAELHQTIVEGGGSHSHGGGGGGESMAMGEVEGLDVAAGDELVFEPGGNHVMLVDLADELVLGEEFVLTLTLASGRTLDVRVVVADNPPG